MAIIVTGFSLRVSASSTKSSAGPACTNLRAEALALALGQVQVPQGSHSLSVTQTGSQLLVNALSWKCTVRDKEYSPRWSPHVATSFREVARLQLSFKMLAGDTT